MKTRMGGIMKLRNLILSMAIMAMTTPAFAGDEIFNFNPATVSMTGTLDMNKLFNSRSGSGTGTSAYQCYWVVENNADKILRGLETLGSMFVGLRTLKYQNEAHKRLYGSSGYMRSVAYNNHLENMLDTTLGYSTQLQMYEIGAKYGVLGGGSGNRRGGGARGTTYGYANNVWADMLGSYSPGYSGNSIGGRYP